MTAPLRRVAWWLVPLTALTASYLPDLGRGFIRDDFAWILGSRTVGPLGWLDLWSRHNGFYRPLVSASFKMNEALFGLDPWWYGLTNFLLVVACVAALHVLGLALRMPCGAALVAASLWALNPHGIGGAILWISGRTSLLLTLFALLAAIACLAALFCKEEAVLLPVILIALASVRTEAEGATWDRRRALRVAALFLVPLVLYFALRARTGAYLPGSAPAFYRPALSPALLARNVLEYADRGGTLAAAVVIVAFVIVRRRPALQPLDRYWMTVGTVWLVAGYGLTVFLPVRSSLYACFPSVGAALIAATVVHALWREAGPAHRRVLLALAILVPIALVPLHRSRNVRLRKTAELSATVLEDLGRAQAEIASGRMLVLHDAVGIRYNVENTFGTLIQDAVRLRTGLPARVWVDPPLEGWEGAGLVPPEGPTIHLWLRDGRLVPLG